MPRFADVVDQAPEGLPDHLVSCMVEDWSERSGLEGQVEAFRLFLLARRAWCDEQGVDRSELPAAGAPRWGRGERVSDRPSS